MYTDYKKKQKNRKALLLLLVLGVFGFVAFKYTKVEDIVAKDNSDTQATTCTSGVVDNSYESDGTFWYLDNNGALSDATPSGNVLGTSSSSSSCSIAKNNYSGTSACILDSDTSTSLTNGKKSLTGRIKSDATISMAVINAPIILLSGSYNVENSIGNLTSQNGYIPPAGKVVKNVMTESSTTPGEEHDQVVSEIIDASVKQEAFSVEYEVSTDTNSGEDELTIDDYAGNNCGSACDNEPNINPDLSNKASARLYGINYGLPGYSSEEETDQTTEILQIEEICNNVDNLDLKSSGIPACFNFVELIKGTFGSLFPSSNWQCEDEDGDETDCINAEDIAVKISPMFDETNNFTETRVREQMDPTSASSYEPTYVITNCLANVGGNNLISVKCVWDLSYLFNERQAAEFDDIESGETPSLDEYKTYLEKQSTERQNETLFTM